ncbi:MAG: DUF885 domain-containing protein [Gammaproteobacteria bacterium]|nr:DUF885 domain-containing protein [Gammaproteobacteria bacterium]
MFAIGPARQRRLLMPAIALLLFPVSSISVAQSSADEAFEKLASDYVDALPMLSPVNATLIGDHRRDDQLDEIDAAGRANRIKIYRDFRERLGKIDSDNQSRAAQVDADLLHLDIESNLWNLEVFQEWAWNPVHYVNLSGSAIYGLMARDFAPIETRLENAAARLEQLPRFFEQSRAALQPARVPKIHAETAIKQNPGLTSIIDTMIVPNLDKLTPESRARAEAAIESAKSAIAEHQTWLEGDLLPAAAGEFRIGAFLFDQKLKFTLNSTLSRREIRLRAEDEYVSVRNQMYAIAKDLYIAQHPYSSFPDQPDEPFKQVIIRAALEQAYEKLPDRDAIVDIAKQNLQQTTDFVRERNIVTVPDDPIDIIIMPEFQRGVAVAYLDPPGPLDRGQKSFYAVAPLPSDWTDEQARSFLREYNLLSIQNLTIHEAMPGHYLQLALSNRYPSVLRAVLWSGPFAEGWAVYAERVMIDEGYLDNDPLMRLINLKWYLRVVTNAIIDQAIHVDDMSRDAAMKLMIEGGFQEEREAAGKWVRAQLTSTQLSTYFVGYQEHIDMRRAVEAAWGDEFTLRRYHDQALSYGSPSVKYVRALILDQEIPRSR